MLRATAALIVFTTIANVSTACPRWGRRCPPRPVVVYSYCPPPVVVYIPCPPPPAIVAQAEPAKDLAPRPSAEVFDVRDLYKKVVKSSVFIVTPVRASHRIGSGSLIDVEKKLVLTSYHVVDEEETVFVQFPMFVKDKMITDKKVYMDNIPAGLAIKGKVIFRDKTRDLALVELASVPPGTPAIKLAKKSPEQAEEVWNVGSPGDVNQVFSVTRGEGRAVAPEKLRVGSEAC